MSNRRKIICMCIGFFGIPAAIAYVYAISELIIFLFGAPPLVATTTGIASMLAVSFFVAMGLHDFLGGEE